MIIGVPKEIKDHEYRVAMLPSAASLLGGINVLGGKVTHKAVAEAHGMEFSAPKV